MYYVYVNVYFDFMGISIFVNTFSEKKYKHISWKKSKCKYFDATSYKNEKVFIIFETIYIINF